MNLPGNGNFPSDVIYNNFAGKTATFKQIKDRCGLSDMEGISGVNSLVERKWAKRETDWVGNNTIITVFTKRKIYVSD